MHVCTKQERPTCHVIVIRYAKKTKQFCYLTYLFLHLQGRQTNQVNQCICTTTFSAPPQNSRQKVPVQGKNKLSKVGFWEQLSDEP